VQVGFLSKLLHWQTLRTGNLADNLDVGGRFIGLLPHWISSVGRRDPGANNNQKGVMGGASGHRPSMVGSNGRQDMGYVTNLFQ
jgi:hypothetical protein